uniref:CCHC-type domain-containing protein n=1 Tax=Aegilops tauschii subsp. strangulata TaxID=200361 RepID=A0A453SCV0_AEGTS
MATQSWIAEKLVDWVKKNPGEGAKAAKTKLEGDFNFKLKYSKAWEDRTQWEQVDLGFMVYPPVQEKRPPGRPRVQRIRGFLEDPGRKVVKCKKCGRNGHFAKTCNLPPLVIAEPPPMEHTPTKRCHCTYLNLIMSIGLTLLNHFTFFYHAERERCYCNRGGSCGR